jgi:uncharacterized protein YndB with AHSA1/START domain
MSASDIVIIRVFDAPRARVFRAWIEPYLAMRWWAPRDRTTISFEMVARPGGAWRATLRAPSGAQSVEGGIVREVALPERLIFTHASSHRPRRETLVSVAFTQRDGKTQMIFRQSGFTSTSLRDLNKDAWIECFDQLESLLQEALTAELGTVTRA